MSEWIKREDREPAVGEVVLVAAKRGPFNFRQVFEMEWHGSDATSVTHWMPLPAPPPRTVTIEISEDDAEWLARYGQMHLPETDRPARIIEACRKALEAKR